MPTNLQRTIATTQRSIQISKYYRDVNYIIPNDDNWSMDTKNNNYRLYRQALNVYKDKTGKPWIGTFKACIQWCERNREPEPEHCDCCRSTEIVMYGGDRKPYCAEHVY